MAVAAELNLMTCRQLLADLAHVAFQTLLQRIKTPLLPPRTILLSAPHFGVAEFGGGKASWTLETRYPFREKAILSLTAEKPFALRLRVQTWCRAFNMNETDCTVADGWVDCNQPGDIPFMPVVGDGEEVDLRFVPMPCQRCHVTVFPHLGGAW